MDLKIDAIIVAAGRGARMGAEQNKVFLPFLGREMLAYTMEAFENCNKIRHIFLVTRECDAVLCEALVKKYGFQKVLRILPGGTTRQASVYQGLKATGADLVCIHDGARALIEVRDIERAIEDCVRYGAAALGVKCKDTLKETDAGGFIQRTVDRERIYHIQTPQVFYNKAIRAAHDQAAQEDFFATDDCALLEHYGGRIKITEGSYENIKLTTPEDIVIGERIYADRTRL